MKETKKRNDWEDELWEKDYEKISKELNIPKVEPKQKIPLLIKLKILSDEGRYVKHALDSKHIYYYKHCLTEFGKKLMTLLIVVPIIGLSIFGGFRQWNWNDEVVWGIKVGSSNVQTDYRLINATGLGSGDYFDYFELGEKIPCKVRERVIRNPKPWVVSDNYGFARFDGPARINWKLMYEIIQKENRKKVPLDVRW